MSDNEQQFSNKTTRTGGYRSNNKKERVQNRTVEILPHPDVLESYNYVVEGSAQTILSMFEIEQRHRHEWERQALRIHSYSTIIGQVLGFLIAVSVFVSASVIGVYGNTTVAAFIWIFGLSIVVMAGLVWSYAKSMGQRPIFARPTMRTHFRPVKEKQMPQEQQEPQPDSE